MSRFKATLIIIAVAAVSFLIGRGYRSPSSSNTAATTRRILYYHDPMHPSYRSERPGIAPDCGMQLEPVYERTDLDSEKGPALGTVNINFEEAQRSGVRVMTVNTSPGSNTLRLLGRVAADENRIYRLNSSVEGWVRRTEPHVTGSLVRKNERLAAFYSPEFYSAQQAYFYALGAIDRLKAAGADSPEQLRATGTQVRTSGDSLRNLGMSDLQLEEISKTREIVQDIWVTSPGAGLVLSRNISAGQRFEKGTEFYRIADLGRVWIMANLFQSYADYVHAGARATVRLPEQNKSFVAIVSAEPPRFDAETRTLKLRLEADNPGFVLRPDMFVDVELPLRLPKAVVVPADAIIDTGMHKTVFVELAPGTFEPRIVEAAWRHGEQVGIARGLNEGERIVVSGNFLIDSESKFQLAAAGLTQAATKDPVCSMDVEPSKAGDKKADYKGKTFYFCSDSCKKKFQQSPEKYAPGKESAHAEDHARGPA